MNRHAELVKALVKSGKQIKREISDKDAHLIHMTMGVSGESGELLDAIKKHAIYRNPLDIENVREEMGDIEFFLEGIRQALNLTREECIAHNIRKLTKRYGKQYSNKSARARADKV